MNGSAHWRGNASRLKTMFWPSRSWATKAFTKCLAVRKSATANKYSRSFDGNLQLGQALQRENDAYCWSCLNRRSLSLVRKKVGKPLHGRVRRACHALSWRNCSAYFDAKDYLRKALCRVGTAYPPICSRVKSHLRQGHTVSGRRSQGAGVSHALLLLL
jgi:hypothetical protein